MCFLQHFWSFCGTSSLLSTIASLQHPPPPIFLSSLFLPQFSDPACSPPLPSSFFLRLPSLLHAYPVVLLPPSSHSSQVWLSPLCNALFCITLPPPPYTFCLSYEFQLKPDHISDQYLPRRATLLPTNVARLLNISILQPHFCVVFPDVFILGCKVCLCFGYDLKKKMKNERSAEP